MCGLVCENGESEYLWEGVGKKKSEGMSFERGEKE